MFELEAPSESVPPSADRYTFALEVNGTPVWIDGWRPELVRIPLSPNEPFSLAFGLENLDFSGADAGLEHIVVEVRYLRGQSVLVTREMEIEYTALRSTSGDVTSADGTQFDWSAVYQHPLRENKYQVFVAGGATQVAAEQVKSAVDRAGETFDEQPIVGVIRPPLHANPNFGVVFGIKEESGQIRFTFDAEDASRVCERVLGLSTKAGLADIFRSDAYRYEMEPRAPGRSSAMQCRIL